MKAGPFVAVAFEIEAVGFEGVAEGADGAALVVVAADGPLGLVLIGGVCAEIDDPPGMEVGIDEVKDHIVAEGSVTGDGVDAQVGVEGVELEQQGSGRVLLALVGGQEIIEQNQAETAGGVSQLNG
jgi:hypothetical protein